MDAQDKVHAVPDDATVDQVQPLATKMVQACQAANAVMLRQSWPPNVTADIRAEVSADGAILGDLTDLANNASNLARDSGPANAAANIVRADLGLPPIS